MLSDLNYAFRQLTKSPGFTVVAVLSLALGIGANTAIFSLVNEVLVRSLPVKSPQELVVLKWTKTKGDAPLHNYIAQGSGSSFSLLTYERLRNQNDTLSEIFASGGLWESNVVIDGQAEVAEGGQLVSGNYFSALGIQPFLGRMIADDDDRPGSPPVAVISYRYWQRRFDGQRTAIGKVMRVNNVLVTLIGVTPPGFLGVAGVGSPRDISVPLAMWSKVGAYFAYAPDQRLSNWWICIMGRLKPGSSTADARASLVGAFEGSVREIYSNMNHPPKKLYVPDFEVKSAARSTYEDSGSRRSLLILMGLAGLVLLVACGNVANLLLARGAARQKEIAVRLGLGAGRVRVVCQLLTESAVLAILGGALGLLFASWTRGLLLALHPLGRSVVFDLPLDPVVLSFTFAISAVTCLLFGMAPALRATRLNLAADLQGGTRGGGSRPALRLGKGLMVAQVSLSVVLLVGAGLFLRTLQNIQNIDAGFNRHQLLLFRVDSTRLGYKPDRFTAICDRISSRLGTLPGIRSVAFSAVPVLSDSLHGEGVSIPGHKPPAGQTDEAAVNSVSSNFFETFGVPILIGRSFNAHDDNSGFKVVVINQTMAKKYFGDESPLGHRADPMGTIVGVARDMKYLDLKDAIRPTLFQYFPQSSLGQANFAVRTTGDSKALMGSILQVARAVDPALALADVRTQDEEVEDFCG